MQNQILSETTAKITNEQKYMCDDMINLKELNTVCTNYRSVKHQD